MGSGMLWAALGGAAKAGTQVMDDQVKREDDERKRAQSIADSRNNLLFEMKAKADYARNQEAVEADAYERVVGRSKAIDSERGAKQLEVGRGMLASEGEFTNDRITPEMIASMPPQARAIYEREMGLTDDSPLQVAKDRLDAGRELGAPGAVRKELAQSYDSEVKTERARREQERKDKRDDQRYESEKTRSEQRDRQGDQRDTQLAQQLQIANDRNQPGSGSSRSEMAETLKYLDSSRKSLDSDAKDVRAAMKAELDNARGSAKKDAIRAEYEPRIKQIEEKRAEKDRHYNALGEKLFGGSSKDASAGRPGEAIVNPKGGPKAANTPWVSQNTQSDQVRIIESELAKARASGSQDVAALERELARLGAPANAVAQQSTKKDNKSISALPPDSKQIGHSGGRPVFQAPDGKKYIQ